MCDRHLKKLVESLPRLESLRVEGFTNVTTALAHLLMHRGDAAARAGQPLALKTLSLISCPRVDEMMHHEPYPSLFNTHRGKGVSVYADA